MNVSRHFAIWLAAAAAPLASAQDGDGEVYIYEPAPLDPVYVYSDRDEAAPGSISTLDADAILNAAADHPAEALNRLPGVNIQMNSGQEHLISLRSPVLTGGAGQGSFLILENGVPTRAAAFGNVNALFELHHEVADAIEVVRGPASAKYGSNAVHGLINVIHTGPGGTGLEARASASTLSRYRTDVIADGDTLKAALSIQKDLGWRDFTGVDQQKATLIGDTSFAGWTGQAWIIASNLNQETADFLQGPKAYRDEDLARTNDDPLAGRDAWSIRAGSRLSRDTDLGALTITPYAVIQEMAFRQHFLPNKSFEENGHTTLGLLTKVETQTSDTLTLRYGVDAAWARGDLKETQDEPFGFFPGDSRFPAGVHYDYTVDTLTLGLWGEADWAVSETVSILAGLRAEGHRYDYTTDAPVGINGRFRVPEDREDDFSLLTPKLGVIWTPLGSAVSYYANYARGERAPQASDLYRVQEQQEPSAADTETLDSLEIGVRGAAFGDRLLFDVAAYTAQKENFFFRDANGLNVTDGKTDHSGIEAALDAVLLPDTLTLRGAVSWSDQTYAFNREVRNAAEVIVDGNDIDTAPEWLANLSLVWTPSEALEAAFEANHVGEYFTNAANTAEYPGHTVFHARVSLAATEDLGLDFIVRNIFDLQYADRADFAFGNDRYFPGEPLNATVRVRKQF